MRMMYCSVSDTGNSKEGNPSVPKRRRTYDFQITSFIANMQPNQKVVGSIEPC